MSALFGLGATVVIDSFTDSGREVAFLCSCFSVSINVDNDFANFVVSLSYVRGFSYDPITRTCNASISPVILPPQSDKAVLEIKEPFTVWEVMDIPADQDLMKKIVACLEEA